MYYYVIERVSDGTYLTEYDDGTDYFWSYTLLPKSLYVSVDYAHQVARDFGGQEVYQIKKVAIVLVEGE